MRRIVILAAVVALAVIAAVVADAVLGSRIEDRAARALRADVAEQTGGEPDDVRVSLRGAFAALRLVTGPAPDATATIRGIDIPGTGGSLTRLRVDLEDVDADIGEVLSGSGGGSLPFTAGSGRFSAVLDEEDLNATVGEASLLGRLELRDEAIVSATSSGVPFIAELGEAGAGGGALVLRPAPDAPVGPLLANSTITIPLVLPRALILEAVRVEEGRLVGEGRVDTEALTRSG